MAGSLLIVVARSEPSDFDFVISSYLQMENIYEPEFVKLLFNRMSSSYERMNIITSFGFSVIWRKKFIDKLGADKSEIKVIDLLSGLGENWITLIKYFPNATFFALDFSEEMYRASKQKSVTKLGNRFEVYNQDILKNKLPTNEFDIVTCAFGLKTFNEKQIDKLAQTIYRILKPSGKFTFIEVSKPKNKVLHFLYKLYLKRIIPVLGKIFLGNPSDYRMLWQYTEKFESCNKIIEIFKRNNLEAHFDCYFYGCATGVSGIKKS